MQYTLHTNLDSRFARAYEPGDRLVGARSYHVESHALFLSQPTLVLDQIWSRHQRDDRPDGQLAPSLSVGDVIVIGESAWSVASIGFTPVTLRREDITGTTYLEAIGATS